MSDVKAKITSEESFLSMRDLHEGRNTAYRILQARMLQEIEGLRTRLETPCEPEQTSLLRGQILGMRLAIAYPEKLLTEFTKSNANQRQCAL